MKSLRLTPVPVPAAALFTGVACSETTLGSKEGESSERDRKDFESAAVVFQHAAEKYTYAKRAKFIAELKNALKETRSERDDLSSKEEGLSGAAKVKARQEIKELRVRRTLLEKQNDAAMTAPESKWDGIRDGITDTFTALMDSFRRTRTRVDSFKENGGPSSSEPTGRLRFAKACTWGENSGDGTIEKSTRVRFYDRERGQTPQNAELGH